MTSEYFCKVENDDIILYNIPRPLTSSTISFGENATDSDYQEQGYYPLVPIKPEYDPVEQNLIGPVYTVDVDLKIVNATYTVVQKDLTAEKNRAYTSIDNLAEISRLLYITKGSGQALEYKETKDEAVAAATTADPLTATDWPMLNAELLAQIAAGADSNIVTLRTVITDVMTQNTQWIQAAASIKTVRRAAKLLVDTVSTVKEIDTVLATLDYTLGAALPKTTITEEGA